MARILGFSGVVAVATVLSACGGGSGGGSDTSACTTAATETTASVVPTEVSKIAALVTSGTPLARAEAMLKTSGNDVSPTQARPALQVQASSVSLGELSQARVAAAVASSAAIGVPRKVGLARDLIQTANVTGTTAVLNWQSTASGGKAAAISISSASAKGVRLGVLVRSLPADATLRVYAQGSTTAFTMTGQEVAATLQRNADAGDTSDAARIYWTPLIDGSEATLEIELSAQASTADVQIAIPKLSHLYSSMQISEDGDSVAKIGQSASCEVNVACNTSYSSESNSVARMVFVGTDGGSYVCSGALVNDTNSSGTPYFLSANHCISKQSEASTLQTYWFYRANTCAGTTLNPSYQIRSGGASLLYASSVTDTSFMLLVSAPPTGVTYAGWSVAAPTLGAAAVGLHHPEGDLQKVSTGTVSTFQDCTALDPVTNSFSCSTSTQSVGKFLNATFSSGSTEAGSSGSPLFQGSSHYLVGQLFGGSASCSNPSGSNIYGRFDVAYNTALSQWLNSSSASLSVTTLGNGTGTVTSSPAGISCGATCATPFPIGTAVTVTATPASGATFTGWGGACSGTSNSCSLTMSVARAITATFTVPAIALATALDDALTWIAGGDVGFYGQTTTAKTGGSAAQSGRISDSQSSSLSTTVTGPGTMSFDWKVSSEADHDLFTVYIDGVAKYYWSGEAAWYNSSLTIPAGSHTVSWTYAKDSSNSSGQDAGWVDNVVFTSSAGTCTRAATGS
ncbi:serine protease [Rhodoferax sp.]|uniref:InlB B-repeat-containing protein n=1 Tax=Rhodoferax sp. TaxID=50421 RepID=UPI00374DABFD